MAAPHSAIERGEEEDEHAECRATDDKLDIGVLVAAEEVLQLVHRLGEVERHEATYDPQEDDIGYTLHGERVDHGEVEHRLGTRGDIGDRRRRDARDEQRHERRHGEVYEEHLDGEHQSGDGSLEDARHGTCRTAPYEEHHRAGIDSE